MYAALRSEAWKPEATGVELCFGCLLAVSSLSYWGALAYAAWLLGGWRAAAFTVAIIAVVVTFALSMARVSGRCSRIEEGLADGS